MVRLCISADLHVAEVGVNSAQIQQGALMLSGRPFLGRSTCVCGTSIPQSVST